MLNMCVSNSVLPVYMFLYPWMVMWHFCNVIYIMPTTIQTHTILQALHQQSLLTCLLWGCKVHLCLNKDRNCFCADYEVKEIGCEKFYVYKTMRETYLHIDYFLIDKTFISPIVSTQYSIANSYVRSFFYNSCSPICVAEHSRRN